MWNGGRVSTLNYLWVEDEDAVPEVGQIEDTSPFVIEDISGVERKAVHSVRESAASSAFKWVAHVSLIIQCSNRSLVRAGSFSGRLGPSPLISFDHRVAKFS